MDVKEITAADKGWAATLNNNLKALADASMEHTTYDDNVVLENGWTNALSNVHLDIYQNKSGVRLSHVMGCLQTPSGWNGSSIEAIRIGGAPAAYWPYVGAGSIDSHGTLQGVVSYSIDGGGNKDLTVKLSGKALSGGSTEGWVTVNFWY